MAQLVYCYVINNRHRNSEGLFLLPKPYIAHEMRQPQRDVKEAIKNLEEAGYISYDEKAEVILDRKALIDYKPNPNQVKGAVAKVVELPNTPLKAEFLKLVHSINGLKDLYEHLVAKLPRSLSEAFDNPSETLSEDFRKARDRDRARARQLEGELENESDDSKLVEIGSRGGRA